MSNPKVWTLPALLDRIWMLSRGRRTAVEVIDEKRIAISLTAAKCVKRVATGWDEDYKPRTYELNKISAASAAALYERIKTMRATQKEWLQTVEKIKAEAFERGRVYALDLVGKAHPEFDLEIRL